ncbi:MAG: pyruvate kinase [Deltaproteobacteria bacterium]|nr:pyruvate kinase [Deltaproteobacteria bacterium]
MTDSGLFRKTKIVCTVGPALKTVDMMKNLIEAGMNVARFNFSHGEHGDHRDMIQMVREASAELGIPVALLADTKGPEIRTGEVLDETPIVFERGNKITLTTEQVQGTSELLSISYDGLPGEVKKGTRILIADGVIELEVLRTAARQIDCLILSDGVIGSKKNVNVIGVQTHLPAVSEKDRADLAFVMQMGMDFVAASFVRKAGDIQEIQKLLESHRQPDQNIPLIIAKIEDEEGLCNIDEIIRISSGIMVARGDLGVQLPPEEIPLVQKKIIRKCNAAGKVVIVATQMLDSMIRNPLPTRAEAADVANAILDGADAVMLSGETAQGKYPVEAAAMMHRIALEVENSEYGPFQRALDTPVGMCDGIALSAVLTAQNIDAGAIVAPTYGGSTPRLLSRFRPHSPIVAVTPFAAVQRRLQLYRGVYPFISPEVSDTDTMIKKAVTVSQKQGFIKPFDKYVLAAGMPIGSPIMLNTVRVDVLADVVVHGLRGFGEMARGRVVKAGSAIEAMERTSDLENAILVVAYIDDTYIPMMRNVVGYVVEHFSSTPFEMLSKQNPSLVGIAGTNGGFENIVDGEDIVLNGKEKLVMRESK